MVVEKLSQYGHVFQLKLMTCLMTDRAFLQQISDILVPEFFESESNSWIVKNILEYYSSYDDCPTLDVFKIKVADIKFDVLKMSVIEALKDILKYTNATDLQFVKDESLKFCKNQCIKNAILESVELLQNGKYDDIKRQIDNAMKAGADKNIGSVYNNSTHVDKIYSESTRQTIKTPWDVINDISAGGFGKGELIIFIAGPGGGKSTSLVNIGVNAVKSGLTVVHYTMELSEDYTSQRYDAVLTGMASQNLKYHLDEVKSARENLSGKLIIKYYPTKTATVTTLRSHLDKLKIQGITPNLVIVDYADLLRSGTRREKLHEELESVYEELRGMAGEFELPVLSASQANRSASEDEIIEGNKVAGAYSKIMIGDFVISLSRTVTDKISGTGRWHIIKNRFGVDGITFPSRLNMSNGRIDIYAEQSIQGKQTQKTMDNKEEVLRQTLAKKYSEIGGNTFG